MRSYFRVVSTGVSKTSPAIPAVFESPQPTPGPAAQTVNSAERFKEGHAPQRMVNAHGGQSPGCRDPAPEAKQDRDYGDGHRRKPQPPGSRQREQGNAR